jgi:hypothetical protein
MKLSGHNFENDVFGSLLDGLSKDVELKKTAQTNTAPDVSDFFSASTASDLDNIQQEDLNFMASELAFAAEKARVAVTAQDLAKFACQSRIDGLRGKALERAAQKYCNKLENADNLSGTTKISANDLIDQLASHKVIPAGYNPEHGSNDSVTGKFMGSSKNPNTIWDTDALQRQAQIALGDEKIKASKQAQADHKQAMKTAQWQELQDKHSDPQQLHKGISNAGTSPEEEVVNQKTAANTMSIFSDKRDFEDIPAQTIGEELAAQAESRANKRAESSDEDRDIQAPMNTKDSMDSLFN